MLQQAAHVNVSGTVSKPSDLIIVHVAEAISVVP